MGATVNLKTFRAALGAGRAAGLELGPLLERAGIDPASLDDPDARFSRELWVELWEQVEALSGDPCVGLHAAERLPPEHFDLIDYLLASSENLGSALKRFERYFAIISTGVTHRLRPAGDLWLLEREYAPNAMIRAPHPAEFAFACVMLRTRAVMEIDWVPHSVRFAHRAPPSDAEHRRIFQCPVSFEADVSAIALHPETLELPMRHPRPELCRLLEAHGQELLRRLPSEGGLLDQTRRALLGELRGGDPNLGHIARKLGTSPRTLQRRLREQGTSHQALLDEIRRDLAVQYLGDASLVVAEVAFLLGFSEVSNFYRAFKRWTGTTPVEFRRTIS